MLRPAGRSRERTESELCSHPFDSGLPEACRGRTQTRSQARSHTRRFCTLTRAAWNGAPRTAGRRRYAGTLLNLRVLDLVRPAGRLRERTESERRSPPRWVESCRKPVGKSQRMNIALRSDHLVRPAGLEPAALRARRNLISFRGNPPCSLGFCGAKSGRTPCVSSTPWNGAPRTAGRRRYAGTLLNLRVLDFGAPGRTRTCDPQLRRLML